MTGRANPLSETSPNGCVSIMSSARARCLTAGNCTPLAHEMSRDIPPPLPRAGRDHDLRPPWVNLSPRCYFPAGPHLAALRTQTKPSAYKNAAEVSEAYGRASSRGSRRRRSSLTTGGRERRRRCRVGSDGGKAYKALVDPDPGKFEGMPMPMLISNLHDNPGAPDPGR